MKLGSSFVLHAAIFVLLCLLNPSHTFEQGITGKIENDPITIRKFIAFKIFEERWTTVKIELIREDHTSLSATLKIPISHYEIYADSGEDFDMWLVRMLSINARRLLREYREK